MTFTFFLLNYSGQMIELVDIIFEVKLNVSNYRDRHKSAIDSHLIELRPWRISREKVIIHKDRFYSSMANKKTPHKLQKLISWTYLLSFYRFFSFFTRWASILLSFHSHHFFLYFSCSWFIWQKLLSFPDSFSEFSVRPPSKILFRGQWG